MLFLEHVWVDLVSGFRHVCQERCWSYWSLKTEQSKNDNSILNWFSLANTKLELVVFKRKCVKICLQSNNIHKQCRFFNQGSDCLWYIYCMSNQLRKWLFFLFSRLPNWPVSLTQCTLRRMSMWTSLTLSWTSWLWTRHLTRCKTWQWNWPPWVSVRFTS